MSTFLLTGSRLIKYKININVVKITVFIYKNVDKNSHYGGILMNVPDNTNKIKPIRSIPGALPEPDDLIGRENTINDIKSKIQNVNILLLSPRRFGKSGILNYLHKKGINNFLPIYIMVEEISQPEVFISELIKVLASHDSILNNCISQIPRLPGKLFNWIKKQGSIKIKDIEWKPIVDEEISWLDLGNLLFHELEKFDKRIVFMIDEFPKMIERFHNNNIDIDTFLSWFRSCRITENDALRKHRYIITGSIGINYLLRKTRTTTALNDLDRIYVGEISEENANILLKGLYLNYYKKEPGEEFLKKFFEILDCRVPFFIHLYFDQLRQDEEGRKGNLSPEVLRNVFWKSLLGERCKAHFDHYYDRLKNYGPERRKAAEIVLRKLAAENRMKRMELFRFLKAKSKIIGQKIDDAFFNDLMADLEVEWYILLENSDQALEKQSYCFKIPLLARWWNRFYPSLEED